MDSLNNHMVNLMNAVIQFMTVVKTFIKLSPITWFPGLTTVTAYDPNSDLHCGGQLICTGPSMTRIELPWKL